MLGEERQIKVLVVEDDPDAAVYVRTVLQRTGGMEVTVSDDGAVALELLRAERFDLLVTDIELPGLSGLEMVRALRADGLRIPVIVMTAYASVDYAIEALRDDVDEFLVKPLDSARLVERARALVEEARRAGTPTPKERVLAVGAHPDDVEIGVGATLAAHRAAGDDVTVLTLSRGAVGGQASSRADEAAAAAAVIGADLLLLDFEDTRLEPIAAVIRAIEDVVERISPSIVYTHSANDRHQDHRAVHQGVDVAARRVPTVLCFQSPSATIDFKPARFSPVDDHIETKLRMLAAFSSQAGRDYMQPEVVRATARYWSRFGIGSYAEPMEALRAVGRLGLMVGDHSGVRGHDQGTSH
ncbi:response regulator [Isoptericola jiangsuensis]|uniref:response regulator n=1 Tax=Isoptericola jiangsuensis TaxID=548579 RepID=UPI003AAC1330